MKITLNGKDLILEKQINLIDFLESKEIEIGKVVVEYNFNIMKKDNLDKIILKDNDVLEILKFVGGG